MKKSVNKKLVRLKMDSYELMKGGNMPPFLFQEIAVCGVDTSTEYIEFLKYATEKLLRVKHFYHKYSFEELSAKDWFDKEKKERGYA